MKKLQYLLLLAMSLLMSGCATNISSDTYSVESVRVANRSETGVIQSFRPVKIEGSSNAGALIGGAVGAVTGSFLGGNNRIHALGAIAGATIGAFLGSAAEKGITNQDGIEYVIELDNGDTITLIQPEKPDFAIGQKVRVLLGKQARIIPYTEELESADKLNTKNTDINVETTH